MQKATPFLAFFCTIFFFASPIFASHPQQAQATLSVLDKNGSPISQLTDGDLVKLRLQTSSQVSKTARVSFQLDTDDVLVAECTLQSGNDSCQSEPFPSLGWYWSKGGQAKANRQIRASSSDVPLALGTSVRVAPRPAVMVHGFSSSADAWHNYLGQQGFLATMGLSGFAVGDGQVDGKLNTGSLFKPTDRTNTIAENAKILGAYISQVKKLTGAQQVDLLVHSLGGLIARYYIDRVMQERDVAQLLMLGSPNRGTECSILPASLGFYLPASLEIRTEYVLRIFNPQITHRKGVPFYMAAGTPIVEPISSPCTSIPSDLIIARDSVGGVSGMLTEIPILHTDLNESEQVFNAVVKPLLQRMAGQFPIEPDPAPVGENHEALQFTRVFTGHVATGASRDHTIQIDNVAVASFALFDPTRSLTVTVRGATGNVIPLNSTTNGLIVVDDSDTLVYLGYGFNNPQPGAWRVTLQTTSKTPPAGSDYALTAQLRGSAVLKTQTSTLIPQPGEAVRITTRLELAGQVVPIQDARALIRNPSGHLETVVLTGSTERTAIWTPNVPGLYGVDVTVNGAVPGGMPIERTSFLSVEAQPATDTIQPLLNVALIVLLVLCLLIVLGVAVRRVIRR